MNSGYLGCIINPKGDFSFACSALVGLLGFNWLLISSFFYIYLFGGTDFPLIIAYFSLLNTSFWISLWVDNGKYCSPIFLPKSWRSSAISYKTSCDYQAPSHVRHAKLELKSMQGHFLHLRGYVGLCSSHVCLHLDRLEFTCMEVSRLWHRNLCVLQANTCRTLLDGKEQT